MAKMEHQDGYAPSTEDTEKLNEITTWLEDHGFRGIMLLHKDDIGVSWVKEKGGPETFCHDFINALGHISQDSPELAAALVNGMAMALHKIVSA